MTRAVAVAFATTFPLFASPLDGRRESKGTAMAKMTGCRLCRIELARIELADGSVALMCATCEVIGVEHEIAQGGRMWADAGSKGRVQSIRSAGR
jgi:hypothetical protein